MQGQRIILKQYPTGMPGHDDLQLETFEVPAPGEGQVQLRTIYLSLDPYMRGRMSQAKSYAAAVGIGEVITGETVSEVLASNHPDFQPGDTVRARSGWQTHAVLDGSELTKVDPDVAPVSTALGVLGMPGFTGWYGLTHIGKPKEGECVVVAAASGPVGSMVAQLAKKAGAHVVAIAGGEEKCAWIRETLGVEDALDHRAPLFPQNLARACPQGIDVYFENVGGAVFSAVLPLLNTGARIPVCGLIAHYNDSGTPEGHDRVPELMGRILRSRLLLQGYIITDHYELFPEFQKEVAPMVRKGSIAYREDIVKGLENAPEAFAGLLQGKNFGKLVVKV